MSLFIKRVCILLSMLFTLSVLPFFSSCNEEKKDELKEGELRMTFLNVGLGDSAVISLPDGKVVLIDGGKTANTNQSKIEKCLSDIGADKIDILIVTNPDYAHIGNLSSVVKKYKVEKAYLPSTEEELFSVQYANLVKALKESNAEMIAPKAFDILSVSEDEYTFAVLYSTPEIKSEPSSGSLSTVYYLEYAGKRALFLSDITEEEERYIIREKQIFKLSLGIDIENVDIIKVADHGSSSSSSEQFLEVVCPEYAVISTGENNYGYPMTAVVERLLTANADMKVLRTDLKGDITFSVFKNGELQVTE